MSALIYLKKGTKVSGTNVKITRTNRVSSVAPRYVNYTYRGSIITLENEYFVILFGNELWTMFFNKRRKMSLFPFEWILESLKNLPIERKPCHNWKNQSRLIKINLSFLDISVMLVINKQHCTLSMVILANLLSFFATLINFLEVYVKEFALSYFHSF